MESQAYLQAPSSGRSSSYHRRGSAVKRNACGVKCTAFGVVGVENQKPVLSGDVCSARPRQAVLTSLKQWSGHPCVGSCDRRCSCIRYPVVGCHEASNVGQYRKPRVPLFAQLTQERRTKSRSSLASPKLELPQYRRQFRPRFGWSLYGLIVS